ncbi:MAG: response regulator [Polyangiaceae bacterium]|nr:response regulator [Polyangiaceae bacterium]
MTLRVLLVDDELEFLEPTAARFRRRGLTCATARNGEEALVVLGSDPFDCAVIDVKMPGMDGLELLRRMRHDHPDVPVVLLTGHASVQLGVQGMDLGAFEYLLKPVEMDDLLDAVRRAAGA